MLMTTAIDAPLPAPDFRGFANFGYASVAVVCAGFGIWAALAPLSGAVVAPARVSVESESKPVQHLEGGIVREILVREAQPVEEGEVLFRLEPVPLFQKQLITAPRMRGLERDRDRVKGEVEQTRAEIERSEQSMMETRLLLEQARQHQREAVLQQLSEVRARISDAREKLAIAG